MLLSLIQEIQCYFETLNDAPLPELAYGFVLGMFLGLIPFSINSLIITLLIAFLKVDKLSGIIATGIFASLGIMFDPIAHMIGYALLVKATFLKPLWTLLYNTPFLPFSGYNNTVIMGNTVLALILCWPIYGGIIKFINYYRLTGAVKYSKFVFENKYYIKALSILNALNIVKRFKGN